jgi:hypothetical protein
MCVSWFSLSVVYPIGVWMAINDNGLFQLIATDHYMPRYRPGHTTALPSPAMNARGSFDQHIGTDEQRVGYHQAERLGGLEVDYQFELRRRLNGEIARFCAT